MLLCSSSFTYSTYSNTTAIYIKTFLQIQEYTESLLQFINRTLNFSAGGCFYVNLPLLRSVSNEKREWQRTPTFNYVLRVLCISPILIYVYVNCVLSCSNNYLCLFMFNSLLRNNYIYCKMFFIVRIAKRFSLNGLYLECSTSYSCRIIAST